MTTPPDPSRGTRRVPRTSQVFDISKIMPDEPPVGPVARGTDPFAVDGPAKDHVVAIISMARLLLQRAEASLPPNNVQQFTQILDLSERAVMGYVAQRAGITLSMAERVNAASRKAEELQTELDRVKGDTIALEHQLNEFEIYAAAADPRIKELEADLAQVQQELAEAREASVTLDASVDRETHQGVLDQLERANTEAASLRAELEKAKASERANSSRVRRETAVLESRVPVQELDRAKAEIERLKAEKQTLIEAKTLLRRERDELTAKLAKADGTVVLIGLERDNAARDRDAARGDVARFQRERDAAVAERDAARIQAQASADEAAGDREKLKAVLAANRVGKSGMPLLVIAKPQDYAKGAGKSPDQLFELFPAPHHPKRFVLMTELLDDLLAKRRNMSEVQSSLKTFREAELDRFYDPNLPLGEVIHAANIDGKQWFSDLHQHLVVSNAQLQSIHKKLGPLRAERDVQMARAERLLREFSDERARNRNMVHELIARLRQVESELAEIEAQLGAG